jgi:hypothetical protein
MRKFDNIEIEQRPGGRVLVVLKTDSGERVYVERSAEQAEQLVAQLRAAAALPAD